MSDIVKFQKQLLSDPAFRKRFADNPKAVMDEMGIVLPEGVKLPRRISAATVDENIELARAGMEDTGDQIESVDMASTKDVSRVIEEALPLRKKDIVAARQVHESLTNAGDAATVAVVGAVVAAVVAVPVAVVGAESDLALVSNPALVSVSRGAKGLTLHGPNGVRIEGLTAIEAATIIKSFR